MYARQSWRLHTIAVAWTEYTGFGYYDVDRPVVFLCGDFLYQRGVHTGADGQRSRVGEQLIIEPVSGSDPIALQITSQGRDDDHIGDSELGRLRTDGLQYAPAILTKLHARPIVAMREPFLIPFARIALYDWNENLYSSCVDGLDERIKVELLEASGRNERVYGLRCGDLRERQHRPGDRLRDRGEAIRVDGPTPLAKRRSEPVFSFFDLHSRRRQGRGEAVWRGSCEGLPVTVKILRKRRHPVIAQHWPIPETLDSTAFRPNFSFLHPYLLPQMFETLSEKLDGALKTLSGQGRINELNIAQSMREIRRALLDADVNFQVARDFTERIKEQALGEAVLTSIAPGQQLVKIVYDELVVLLGETEVDVQFSPNPPTVILVAGLQGSGKTTFCAKLAKHLRSVGRSPMLAAADVYRPAAVDQLETLAESVKVPVYAVRENGTVVKDAVRVASEAVAAARKNARDVLIIDTAGRLHVDEEMMREVEQIRDAVKPTEILFVVDSMTGQDAVNTAKEFNERLDFDGVVLAKLDGDTRGGAALSIRSVVKKPIKFASTGEKLDALTTFYPDRLAQRILGMGDVVSFVEKAQEQFDEQQADKLRRKIQSESFNLDDFYEQLQRLKKMGSLTDLVGMIPGVGRHVKDMEIDDDAMKHIEAIIQSMTLEERMRPELINGSRRRRIALGSGVEVSEVNQLLKQFREMKKMMKTMTKLMGKGRSLDLGALVGRN